MKIIAGRPLHILDFDCESRPLSFWQPDRPSAEITAIAFCWVGFPRTIEAHLVGQETSQEMLRSFVERYNAADIVTGHYVRKFDLPLINGALMEFGLPGLGPKMVSDTKLDMMLKSDIPASQQYLGELFGLPAAKRVMSQHDWRTANRLTPEGLEKTKERVVADVVQHMQLREVMVERGMLRHPRVWDPGGAVAL